MMFKLLNKIIENKYFKKFLFLSFSFVTFLLLIFENNHFIAFEAFDNDKYGTAFLEFWRLGWYDGCVAGYGILYNTYIGIFYGLTKNIYTSFFIANLISQILCAIISISLIQKFKHKISRFEYQLILVLTIFQLLNTKGYDASYDDSFLSVFISLIIYIIFSKLNSILTDKKSLVIIGLLLAVCLAIRPTTAFLLFSLSIIFLILLINNENKLKTLFFNLIFLVLPFVLFTGILHYPSLTERGKLCFYDKNSKNGANWNQRNYHALKQMQSGNAPFKKDVFWDKKRWEEVDQILVKNGKEHIPDNIIKTFVADPLVVSSITVYNILFTVFWNFRNYGFLILLPIILMFKKPAFDLNRIPFLMFMLICLIVSFVSLTFMEVRWFSGYLILLPIGIIVALSDLKNTFFQKYRNIFFVLSISISLLLNLKSIIALIQQI